MGLSREISREEFNKAAAWKTLAQGREIVNPALSGSTASASFSTWFYLRDLSRPFHRGRLLLSESVKGSSPESRQKLC